MTRLEVCTIVREGLDRIQRGDGEEVPEALIYMSALEHLQLNERPAAMLQHGLANEKGMAARLVHMEAELALRRAAAEGLPSLVRELGAQVSQRRLSSLSREAGAALAAKR